MSHPNTDREERVAKWDKSGLKEACQRALKLGRTHQNTDIQLTLDMLLEIERLESLLDSQATCGQLQDDDELVAEMNTVAANLVRDWYCDSQHRDELVEEIAVTLTAAHRRSEANAATRMRDRCVEKVREMRDGWQTKNPAWVSYTNAANHVIRVLESLQVEVLENGR